MPCLDAIVPEFYRLTGWPTFASRPPEATTAPPPFARVPTDSTSTAPTCASLTANEQLRPLHKHRPPPAVPEITQGADGAAPALVTAEGGKRDERQQRRMHGANGWRFRSKKMDRIEKR